jgi:hypothetical protein
LEVAYFSGNTIVVSHFAATTYLTKIKKMYHFTLIGSIDNLSDSEASKKMTEISQQWEDEMTKFGKLYMGVYDWAFTDDEAVFELHIPKLRTGGEIQKNINATRFFGIDIFGDCFLKENSDGIKRIAEFISKLN